MADVLSRGRWVTRWAWTGALLGLTGLLLWSAPPTTSGQTAPAKAQGTGKSGQAEDTEKDDAPSAPDVQGAPAPDPAQTRRVAPVEVFKDPNAESILDLSHLKAMSAAPFTVDDLRRVEEMAQNPNLPTDHILIDRVVKGLAARLTDRQSIKSLLEGPPIEAPKANPTKKGAAPKKREGDGGKAIQDATAALLKPLYIAQSSKNYGFLGDYRRSLHQFLPPLLKNHLVPRVQAMIVLGEAASPTQEAFQLFQSEITNKSQTLWVKLWALEGISNIKKGGGRFSADQESKAAKTIAEFLEQGRQKSQPWYIQLRGLEALGALRQGYLPVTMARADMANTAMLFLADTNARLEVRAEAARTLGLMQINTVPKLNFKLVAYYAGLLAADVAAEINDQFSDSPPRRENDTKAKYLTAMLVGPVYQCFDGVAGAGNSGILQMGKADPNAIKYIQKVFDMIRPLAQASVELLGAPTKEFKVRKQKLTERISALRQFLTQTPPESLQLVPNGRQFGNAGGAVAAQLDGARPPAMAGVHRGR